MIQILKILWSKYNALEWWKKALLFLPLLIAVILICFFTFWKPSDDSKKFEDNVKYTREQINKYVADKAKQDKALAKQDRELTNKQRILEKEIKCHEERAANITNDINVAAANNDLNQLRRIHRELNSRRKDSTP